MQSFIYKLFNVKLLFFAVILCFFCKPVKAANYYYDGSKAVKYTNGVYKCYYNNQLVSGKDNEPAVMINNNILAPYKQSFIEKGPRLKGNYKNKVVTLYNNTIKITMKLDDKYAYVNGVKKSLNTPAKKVKYNGHTAIYVPVKKITDFLTESYSYKSSNKSAYITHVHNWSGYTVIEKATESKEGKKVRTCSKCLKKETVAIPKIPTKRPLILVIDAGHGGGDSGATGKSPKDKKTYAEKNLTLKIVKAAKAKFDKDSRFKVYYTRLSDSYPSLKARYTLANNRNADLFISVHINSKDKNYSQGTMTLYSRDRMNITRKNNINSQELASTMQKFTQKTTGFKNLGLFNRPNLQVLKYTKMPSCLIEYGYISNAKEIDKIIANTTNYGNSLYNGVCDIALRKGLINAK